MKSKKINTVIIGGGQAGLATGYFLERLGVEFTILEQAQQPASAWRNDRWDSFTLLTPNWSFRLPGAWYDGDDPAGFMTKDEIIRRFDDYVARYQLPIQCGMKVSAVERDEGSYRVITEVGSIQADHVVMATGLFQSPKIPPFSKDLDPKILQLHSGQYRNPDQLPRGAALVVGSAQSGVQIAEELSLNGRTVYLCTGSAGHVPRCYRGKDVFEILSLIGFFDRSYQQLPSPADRFMGSLQLTGVAGGRSINLRLLARDGVRLLGHIRGGNGRRVQIKPDLKQNIASSDQIETNLMHMVDDFIAGMGIHVPPDELSPTPDKPEPVEMLELDLQTAGITSIIWSNGYNFDYSMIKLPVTDRFGFPIQQRGVSNYPGLFFVGLPWMDKMKSGLLLGFGESAGYVAEKIVG